MPSFSSLLLLFITLLNLLPQVVTRGDVLKRTMCFCGTDDHRIRVPGTQDGEHRSSESLIQTKRGPAPPELDHPALQTAWYRFEYYNVHLDHTFVMEETCASNYNSKDDVLAKDCWDYVESSKKYCKYFPLRPNERSARHGRRRHHFCYNFNHRPDDDYTFDGQKRHVSAHPLSLLGYEVREICEPICKERFDKPMMQGRWYWRSSVATFFDEADMCDHCA